MRFLATPFDDYLIGDVNLDSEVNIQDIIIIIQSILGHIELSLQQIDLADINLDGMINILDVVQITNLILDI